MAPRSAHELVAAAFALYRRHPLLFLALAAGVIVPYEVIVLAATGAGPFARGSLGEGISLLLSLIDIVLVGPLVSALHVDAVQAVAEGEDPRLVPIARQGLRVVPVVAAATIMSFLGIALGFLLLIVPGVILYLRWYVVAQAAAIERDGWLPALRRSRELTRGRYRHVIVLAIYVLLIGVVPTVLLGIAFGHRNTTASSFVVGLVVSVFAWSFSALAAGLLYFDLRGRLQAAKTEAGALGANATTSWDPNAYEDRDRPRGWYVDPGAPDRMRYWGLGDPPGWGATTKTPRKIRREWRAAHEADLPGPARDT